MRLFYSYTILETWTINSARFLSCGYVCHAYVNICLDVMPMDLSLSCTCPADVNVRVYILLWKLYLFPLPFRIFLLLRHVPVRHFSTHISSFFFPLSSFCFPLSPFFFYIFPLFILFPPITSADIPTRPVGGGYISIYRPLVNVPAMLGWLLHTTYVQTPSKKWYRSFKRDVLWEPALSVEPI